MFLPAREAFVTPILEFYHCRRPDDRGRFLMAILARDDAWLERTHDYIQWLFPLAEPSRFNPAVPVLGHKEINAFHQETLLRAHMRVALMRMLRFYGLAFAGGDIIRASSWNDRKAGWFTRPTHNNMRITRILRSLTLLGQQETAGMLLAALEKLTAEEPDCAVPADSMRFWRYAVSLPAGSGSSRPTVAIS